MEAPAYGARLHSGVLFGSLALAKDLKMEENWHVSRRKRLALLGQKLQKGEPGTLKINFVRFTVLSRFSN